MPCPFTWFANFGCLKLLGWMFNEFLWQLYYILDNRIIICLSGEMAWHPLQENEAIFSRNNFSTTLKRFSKNYVASYFWVIGSGVTFCISGEKDWCPMQENCNFWRKYFLHLDWIFEKNLIFAYSSFSIDSNMIVGILCEIA